MEVQSVRCSYGAKQTRLIINYNRPNLWKAGVRDASLTDDDSVTPEVMNLAVWGESQLARPRHLKLPPKGGTLLLGIWFGEIARSSRCFVNAVRCDDPEARWLGKAALAGEAPLDPFFDRLRDVLPEWAPLLELLYLEELA